MNTVSPLATGFNFALDSMVQRQSERATPAAAAGLGAPGTPGAPGSDNVSLSLGAPDEATGRLMADAFGAMQGASPLSAHQGLSAERVMRLVGLLE